MDDLTLFRFQKIITDTLARVPGSSFLFWQVRRVAHYIPILRPVVKRAAVRIGRPADVLLRGCKTSLRVAVTYRCGIGCSHCYARGMEEQFSSDMTISGFEEVIQWAKRQKMTIIRFVGGEPTEHPDFPSILEACRRHRMLVQVVTNNLWDEATRDVLDASYVHFICANFSVWNALDTGKRRRFLSNLEACRRLGIPVELNYILDTDDDTLDEMIDVAARHRVALIRASLCISGTARELSGDDLIEELRPLAALVMRFAKGCVARRVVGRLYRPIPLCMFTREDCDYLQRLDRFYYYPRCSIGHAGDYGILITVNPDLSTYPCASVFVKGPSLLDFKDGEEASRFFRGPVEALMRKPLVEACRECRMHRRFVDCLGTGRPGEKPEEFFSFDRCQGGCLSFRDGSTPHCHE